MDSQSEEAAHLVSPRQPTSRCEELKARDDFEKLSRFQVMSHGGARPGSGRKQGGANRVTEEAIAKAEAGGEMPLDYLLRIMRDDAADEAKRIDCAKAAAPYVHPKLVALEAKSETTVTLTGAGPMKLECKRES